MVIIVGEWKATQVTGNHCLTMCDPATQSQCHPMSIYVLHQQPMDNTVLY
jgi:hypothetical protein